MATCAAEADAKNLKKHLRSGSGNVKLFICNLPYEEEGKKIHRDIISGTNTVKGTDS
jgi:hypothetical protein